MTEIEINKTVFGIITCPDCGAEIPIKCNKNNRLYATCRNVIDEGFERCFYERKWGRVVSQKIIREFKNKGENIDVRENQVEQGRENGRNTGTEPRTENTERREKKPRKKLWFE